MGANPSTADEDITGVRILEARIAKLHKSDRSCKEYYVESTLNEMTDFVSGIVSSLVFKFRLKLLNVVLVHLFLICLLS